MKNYFNKIGLLLCALLFIQNALQAQDKMPQILQHFQADKGSLERFYVIDMSPEKRGRMTSFYTEYLNKIKDLPFKSLSQSDKVDYLLFKNQLEANLNELSIEESNYQSSKNWIDFAAVIYAQEKS